jgi:hypothetical protein
MGLTLVHWSRCSSGREEKLTEEQHIVVTQEEFHRGYTESKIVGDSTITQKKSYTYIKKLSNGSYLVKNPNYGRK